MRWLRWTAIMLALCVFTHSVVAQDQPEAEPPSLELPNFEKLQTGIVTRILDENTVLIRMGSRTQRYDLLGVADFRLADQDSAAFAIDSLSRTVLHELVWVQHDPKGERLKDSNRLAAYLFRAPDQLLVNLELVRQGYTKYSSRGMSIHKECFAYQKNRAEQYERGIWAPVSASPQQEVPPDLERVDDPEPDSTSEDQVYVTPHGKRYHRKGCQHLGGNAKPTSRDAVRDSHKPCRSCRPDG